MNRHERLASRFAVAALCLISLALLAGCAATAGAALATPETAAATRTVAPPATRTPVPVARPVGGGDPVVAAAGDIACDPADGNFNGGVGTATSCAQRRTSDLVLARNPAAVLALGDLQYEQGRLDQFQASYDPSWGRLKAITRPAVGNHEYGTDGAAGYFAYFGAAAGDPKQGYYAYDVGTWRLYALNSNCAQAGGCGAGSPQERWLRADLAANPRACVLAYWHHPRWSSAPWYAWRWPPGGPAGNSDMGAIWRALYDGGAELALSGHDHDYERFAPQDPAGRLDTARGVRQFVVGTGGKDHDGFSAEPAGNSEAANVDTHGVLFLTLRADGYDWEFAPVPGQTFTDRGSTACH